MAKIQIIDVNGNKSKEISSDAFDGMIRIDLVQKTAEAEKLNERLDQLYAPFFYSGMMTSASGSVKHNRHVWKTDRGRGVSRYPKKRMSDKGSHFVWVAAAIPGVRGGRRAHPPKLLRKELKINKNEKTLALKSVLAMSASLEQIKKKYASLAESKISPKLPFVIDSKILSLKSKEFFAAVEKILGKEITNIALQEKNIRNGKGKMRGRAHKTSSGMLLIVGNKQEKNISGFEVIKAGNLKVKDISAGSNGARITLFTEEAIKDIENKLAGISEDKNQENKKK